MRRTLDAVFLDRDGVINVDRPDCVHDWPEFIIIPGAIEAIAALSQTGRPVYLVTNQSCIGRGWVPRETVDAIHARLGELVVAAGGRLDGVYLCPHAPDAGCGCRKPAPGMLLSALAEHTLSPEQMVFIADSKRDLEAAAAAKVPSILVRTGKGAATERALTPPLAPLHVADDLAAAVTWLLES